MVDRTIHQIAALIELQEAHEARLRVLQLQAAQQGTQTPPHIITEVKDIQDDVLVIAAQITKLQIAATKAEQREYLAYNTTELADVSLQLSSSTETIQRIQQIMFGQMIKWFDEDGHDRKRRQRMTTYFYIAILVMLAIDISLRFIK